MIFTKCAFLNKSTGLPNCLSVDLAQCLDGNRNIKNKEGKFVKNNLCRPVESHPVSTAQEEFGFCHQVSGEDGISQGEETAQGLGGGKSCSYLCLVGSL